MVCDKMFHLPRFNLLLLVLAFCYEVDLWFFRYILLVCLQPLPVCPFCYLSQDLIMSPAVSSFPEGLTADTKDVIQSARWLTARCLQALTFVILNSSTTEESGSNSFELVLYRFTALHPFPVCHPRRLLEPSMCQRWSGSLQSHCP